MIKVPPIELNTKSSPWSFAARGRDVIGLIEPATSNGHRFILVAIDYFTKLVKAASYKAVTKKSWQTLSAIALELMKAMCETFKIRQKNSKAYRPQMNGDIEAANKNIKKILRKI
ncbi:uncharacterized protein [Nicotiana sylvestris]|uniref:uncharacterized protein n=1 Tax=Nicotiana sylvestris TaxID=4096 RepID=UPI00388C5DEE